MKYTKNRIRMIMGHDMEPCPACGSYHIKWQTPIKMKEPIPKGASVRKIVGAWARATKEIASELEGPVFLMCGNCNHKGPAVDCSGRTSEEIGQDRQVADEVKNLWNGQSK